jgi:hypothetical protein
MSNLYPKIRCGCEQLLIVEVNLITPKAVVVPWFVIVTGIWSERVKDTIEIVQVLASNVFLDKPEPGFHASFA